MTAVVLVYAGLMAALLGGPSLFKPPAFLKTRRRAASVLAAGLAAAGIGWFLPAEEHRSGVWKTRLDEFAPVYQFNEVHTIRVTAPPDRVYRAIQEVTADEIFLFRTLTWLRRLGRPGPESILNAPERIPILEVAVRTGFLRLAEEQDRELLVGALVIAPPGARRRMGRTPGDFKSVDSPGFAKATMNFVVEDAGDGVCVVSTETRVYATDAATRQRFARYWRVIYPGSALIRRMWLRAVKRRAEAAASTHRGSR